MAASCRPEACKHLVCHCGDTVKCRLAPYFDRKVRVRIYVQETQRFWDFVRNITYCSRKGLKMKRCLQISTNYYNIPLEQ